MNRREKLANWIAQQHEGQLIRKTTLPYVHHLVAVAEMADIVPLGYEIGLCHDLLEDTEVTTDLLREALLKFDYSDAEAKIIVHAVVELTDHFTKATYPDWSKSERKQKEAERLASISPVAQTVKYADLIYNLDWMVINKPGKLEKYLRKKKSLIKLMDNGNMSLRLTLIKHFG
jgi:(p)ppGpp synthase/HD superfamily hydrolase